MKSVRAALLSLGCLLVACQPITLLRDGGDKTDAGLAEGGAGDGSAADQTGADQTGRDGWMAWDGSGVDGMLGPRIDAGSIRDATGLDLHVPRHDGGLPPPGTQSCQVWQDCAPHYGDPNSGYDCVSGLCRCDPGGQRQSGCYGGGGQWVMQECYCVFNAEPMPGDDPAGYPDCWWTWVQDSCEPDYWVDTSYQVEECYCCDAYGYDICDLVWVYDGYWESGYCPPGYWDEACY